MSERATFHVMPPEAEREIWCEWLRRHSIDPCDVVVPGWIERRPGTYQVAYFSVERNKNGSVIWDREVDDVVGVERVAQLEGPPLPFPAFDTYRFPSDTYDSTNTR